MKQRGFLAVITGVLILAGMNIFLFANKKGLSYVSISGRVMGDSSNFLSGINLSFVAFVAQWIILLTILFLAYKQFIKHKKQDNEILNLTGLKRKKGRAETDLDILYRILKEKKQTNTEAIGKSFNISEEKALEWAKILENHDLVKIEYPAFSAPEVKIHEEKEKTNQKDKTDKGKKGGEEKEKNQKEGASKGSQEKGNKEKTPDKGENEKGKRTKKNNRKNIPTNNK